MIISGQSPFLLPSSYFTVINRNDSQRYLIGYTWIEKISHFLTLQYVKISIKSLFFCYRYTIESKYFYFTFITFIRQINHSLQKHRSSIVNVWQNSEFASVAGNNLRKSSISDVWHGFEFTFVAINDFRKKIHVRCFTKFWTRFCNLYYNKH